MLTTTIISSVEPEDANVGCVLLREMADCVPPGMLNTVGLLKTGATLASKEETQKNIFCVPNERGALEIQWWRRAQRILKRMKNYEPAIRDSARNVFAHVEQIRSEQLWCILNSTAAIDVAWHLSAQIQIPLLIQVWDDPMYLLMQRSLDRLTRDRTMRRFHQLLGRADRVAVIGESMLEAYRPYTQGEPIIVRHGLADQCHPRSDVPEPTEFRIGFCGGMYSHSAWRAFLAALDHVDWRLADRDVVLVIAGGEISLRASKPAKAIFYGWRSLTEVHSLMSECDLLYMPQAFEGVMRPMTTLSFPTKFSTYVATGRPVFVHTPTYGSLTTFYSEHELGRVANTLEPTKLSEVLLEMTTNPGELKRMAESSAHVSQNVLTRSRFVESVRRFTGCDQ
ncbi:glycosyltransferase [Stieleria varia]|uniref:Glycosyl transferases group 1 n=1 Tax=Stieleria varia TaxID=2528005 RepID=A0A5C6B1A8_9BACT|nr:glycosyltransferase family 4 protein [Stieleria varia]TWU05963.1 hypothetical protein Pla52n_16790 [Stieleria varia]